MNGATKQVSLELHDKYRKPSNIEERLTLLPFDGFDRNFYYPIIKMGSLTRRPFNPVREILYFHWISWPNKDCCRHFTVPPFFQTDTWSLRNFYLSSLCSLSSTSKILVSQSAQPTCNHLVLVRTPAFPLAVAFCLHLCLWSRDKMAEAE